MGAKRLPWQTYENWKEYGLSMGYSERNNRSLYKSKNKTERSWYYKGGNKRWLGKFEFERKYSDCSDWQTREEWREYGLNKGYNERNPTGLYKSKNKDERSWYAKGSVKGWLENFEFKRKKIKNGFWKDLEFTLQEAKMFIKEHNLEDLPALGVIMELGFSSLSNAISKYHNGFPAFREKLREYLGLPSEKNQLESLLESYVNGGEE